MTTTIGYGVFKPNEALGPVKIERRKLTNFDVLIKILYSGVCHSDKHHINNDWGDSKFALVPGHEIIGRIINIGKLVTKLNMDDIVAVGNLADSCRQCLKCKKGDEQYCLNDGPTWVYNGNERINTDGSRTLKPEGDLTYGGYSGKIVIQEDYVMKLPKELDLARSAPLLCAGITMYYPLKHWKIGKDHKVAIAGIGGLGHLGIKFAKALEAEVVALTTSEWKMNERLSEADDYVLIDENYKRLLEIMDKVSQNKPLTDDEIILYNERDKYKIKYREYFDMIICTIPDSHDITPYLRMMRTGQSQMHIVGNMNDYPNLKGFNFVFKGKNITSSNVGGINDTREMLKFCANKNIQADIELIDITQINEAIPLMVNKQVKYRFVIDLTNLE